jgi:putative ABC transport system permease protein
MMVKNTDKLENPPGIARWLVERCSKYEDEHALEGDLYEAYQYYLQKHGLPRARFWYRKQVVKIFFSYLKYLRIWRVGMIKNYFKTIWRSLLKQKIYTIITISGLTVGLGVFLFFLRFYIWALSADSYHKDIDRIYNVVQVYKSESGDDRHTAYLPYSLTPALQSDIPEIEDYTRFYDPEKVIIGYNQKHFFEHQVLFVDRNFFSFFTFDILKGNFQRLLANPNSAVITESIAKKYFGDESPIGKVLTLNNTLDVIVSGITRDLIDYHSDSSLYGQFFIPLEAAQSLYGLLDNWHENKFTGFIRLQKGSDLEQVEEKLNTSRNKYYQNTSHSPQGFYLFPSKGIKFEAIHIQKFSGYSGFIGYTIFLGLGFLFLLIVIFNYVNLSTARYMDRIREVGVRKVIGAKRSQLFTQFLGESILMTFISLPFAILTYNLVCSAFTARVGIGFNLSFWTNNTVIFAFFITTVLTGFVAGLYPAVFLSSFRPVLTLKGKVNKGRSRGKMRKLLVIFQFSTSVILIVMALVWQKQSIFVYNTDLGYQRQGVLIARLPDEAKTNLHLIQKKLSNNPYIINTTASVMLPGHWRTKAVVIPEGLSVNHALRIYSYGIDYGFFKTLGMQIIQGRSFSKIFQDEDKFIINQMLVERMEWDNPIGKSLKVGEREGTIVGIVKDFHFDDPFYSIGPAVFFIEPDNLNYLLIKTIPENIGGVKEYTRVAWRELSPNIPFETFTLDEYFNRQNFSDTHLISEILSILGGIAIFFSCLGLLALASFTVRYRTKEIGIRKVLGASLVEILSILTKDFLKLILIANLIGLPITYLATKSLLEFAFKVRTAMDFEIFIFTSFLTFFIALMAITTQTYKAAQSNPVNALRYE